MNTHRLKFLIPVAGIIVCAGMLITGLMLSDFAWVKAAGVTAAATVLALWGVRIYEIFKY